MIHSRSFLVSVAAKHPDYFGPRSPSFGRGSQPHRRLSRWSWRWPPTLIGMPFFIAEQQGFFADEGLQVTLQRYPFGKLALEAMLRGEAGGDDRRDPDHVRWLWEDAVQRHRPLHDQHRTKPRGSR